jgi:hypothetical protein
MCQMCVFRSIGATDYDEDKPHFGFKCAMCRVPYTVDSDQMKIFMAKFENAAHSREVSCCCPQDCGKKYKVTHRACSGGCYECDGSGLTLNLVSVHEDLVGSEDFDDDGMEEDGSLLRLQDTLDSIPNCSLDEMD